MLPFGLLRSRGRPKADSRVIDRCPVHSSQGIAVASTYGHERLLNASRALSTTSSISYAMLKRNTAWLPMVTNVLRHSFHRCAGRVLCIPSRALRHCVVTPKTCERPATKRPSDRKQRPNWTDLTKHRAARANSLKSAGGSRPATQTFREAQAAQSPRRFPCGPVRYVGIRGAFADRWTARHDRCER